MTKPKTPEQDPQSDPKIKAIFEDVRIVRRQVGQMTRMERATLEQSARSSMEGVSSAGTTSGPR
jgi:hypothetical protein